MKAILPLILTFYLVEFASCANCQDPSLQTLNFFVVSNSFTQVVGPDMLSQGQAVSCYTPSTWNAQIPGATWIWDKYLVSNPSISQTVYFKVQFYIPGVPSGGILQVAADDYLTVTVNGLSVGCDGAGFTISAQKTCNVLPYLIAGMNTAQFSVRNNGGASSPYSNPAGLLYKFNLQARV